MKKETVSTRLKVAIDMFRVGLSLKEAQLRRENPRMSDRAITAKLRAWLSDKPPPGGSDLVRVAWPRSKKSSSSRSKRR